MSLRTSDLKSLVGSKAAHSTEDPLLSDIEKMVCPPGIVNGSHETDPETIYDCISLIPDILSMGIKCISVPWLVQYMHDLSRGSEMIIPAVLFTTSGSLPLIPYSTGSGE